MTLSILTIDKKVRYIPKTEQTRESKPKIIKTGSLPRKQNKKLSQNNKKFIKNVAAGGFAYLKGTTNCYFQSKSILIFSMSKQKLVLRILWNSK